MSHELRTPLNGILGFAHLLQSSGVGPESPKYSRYLAQIGASGRQLQSMIDALLDAAHLQTGTLSFAPQDVDLAALVIDTVDSYRPAAQIKQIELRTRVSDVRTGHLDPMRFRQVLGALLSNAIKFSRDGQRIAVRAESLETHSIKVTVDDHGPGIADIDLPRLFKPFTQIDAGLDRAFDGAGLGLALVKQLVESQGGSVGVQSTLGVGSTFHFTLPMSKPD
jgi:signal transduction histidine kinase